MEGFIKIRSAIFFFLIVIMIPVGSSCVHEPNAGFNSQKGKISSIPHDWKNSEIVILDSKTELDFKLDKKGNILFQTDTVWYYVNKRNPNHMEDIELYQINSYEDPLDITATVYYPDNSSWRLNPESIVSERIPLSNAVANYFSIPRYDTGISIMIQTRHRIFHPEFTGAFFFREEYPALSRTISLSFPADVQLNYGIENGEKKTIEQSETIENGIKKIQFSTKNITDFTQESKTPYPEEYYATLHACFPPEGSKSYSWQDLGNHYLSLSKEAFRISPQIRKLGEQIKQKQPADIVFDSFDTIVKKIRYHGDWDGRYAFIPREAHTILEHGYGDCKEISTILKATLESNNISSCLTLVSTRNHFQPIEKYPHLSNFNHAILARKLGRDKYHFLDGTYSWANSDNSYFHLIGRKAFVLIKDNSHLVSIEPTDTFENKISTVSHIQKDNSRNIWESRGNISLIGMPALEFYSRLNWRGGIDSRIFAKQFLLRNFGIDATDIQLLSLSNSQVIIQYEALFQDNYIPLGKGGFKLGIPNLYKAEVNSELTDKEGPVLISSYIQEDQWIFPFEPSLTKIESIRLPFASCSWKTDPSSVKRIYQQHKTILGAGDSKLKEWDIRQKSIAEACIWNEGVK